MFYKNRRIIEENKIFIFTNFPELTTELPQSYFFARSDTLFIVPVKSRSIILRFS